MKTVQTWEGYYREGSFHTYEPVRNIPNNVRVLITILDDSPTNKRDTWDEFDKLVDEMDEKPSLDDFPRCKFSRPLINFDGCKHVLCF